MVLTSEIAAVGTTFNVFGYYAVWAEHRTHHLPYAEQIRYGRGFCKESLRNVLKQKVDSGHTYILLR